MLLTWHNLTCYQDLMRGLRQAIAQSALAAWCADFAAAEAQGDIEPVTVDRS